MFKEAGLSPKEESDLATAALNRVVQRIELGDDIETIAADYKSETGKVLNVDNLEDKAELAANMSQAELDKADRGS